MNDLIRSLVAAATLLLLAGGAHAELPSLPFPAPPPSPTQILGGQLATGLFPAGEGAAGGAPRVVGVATFSIAVDFAAPADVQGEALKAFVADTLEAQLRARRELGARVAPDAPATHRIQVTLGLARGHLNATARRTVTPVNVWERLSHPAGRVVATAFSTVPAEIEIRTLLGLKPRQARLDRLRMVSVGDKSLPALRVHQILDLAICDADGDRTPELIVLYPDRVAVVRWQDGGFSSPAAWLRLDDGPRSTARVRSPIGRVLPITRADGTTALLVATSDFAEPRLLRLAGDGLRQLDVPYDRRWPLYATGAGSWLVAAWPAGVDVVGGAVAEVRLGAEGATALGGADPAHDIRAHAVRASASPSWHPYLAMAGADGALRVWASGASSPVELAGRGTVAVVADLDANGTAELLTTSDQLDGKDRLTLYALAAGSRGPKRLWSARVSSAVTAAAFGDVDRDGYYEVIVATWDGTSADLVVVLPRWQG